MDKLPEKFLKKLIDDMLAPIGLKTRRGRVRSAWQDWHMSGIFLKDTASGAICKGVMSSTIDEKPPIYGASVYLVCDSYAELIDSLKNAVWIRIKVPGSRFREIANPFFGKDIYELIVSRDLSKNSSLENSRLNHKKQ